MNRHDGHDFRSAMKTKEKLSTMKSVRFDGIYTGKEAEVGRGGGGGVHMYIYIYIFTSICISVFVWCLYQIPIHKYTLNIISMHISLYIGNEHACMQAGAQVGRWDGRSVGRSVGRY